MNRIDATFARAARRRPHGADSVRDGRRSVARGDVPGSCDALVDAGADIIELGVPFSDPMADGPVIQRASERALAQGVGLHDVLDRRRARSAGANATTPIVLMGYANPIEAMGVAAFVDARTRAGVDGVHRRRLSAGGSGGVRGAAPQRATSRRSS